MLVLNIYTYKIQCSPQNAEVEDQNFPKCLSQASSAGPF